MHSYEDTLVPNAVVFSLPPASLLFDSDSGLIWNGGSTIFVEMGVGEGVVVRLFHLFSVRSMDD
jgi:hypothetical protein